MTTVIGALLTVLSCGYIGNALASEKKKELCFAEGFLGLTEYILLRLPELTMLDSILSENRDPFCKELGIDSNKTLLAAIELTKADEPLYGILRRFSETLGKTELARQTQALQSTVDALSTLCRARREKCASTVRCYRYVGFLLGAAAAILLI